MLLGIHYYDKLLNDSEIKKRQEKALYDVLVKYITPQALNNKLNPQHSKK